MEPKMLDQAFQSLATYDWGADPAVLRPIDEAVVATHGDAAARKELESRLAAVLAGDASRAAKDYACRTLRVIGTAASVPALARLLPDAHLSHMARYALERIDASEAAAALRDALPKLQPGLQVGVISSLGARGDAASVPALSALLSAADASVARAAATALGAIRSPEAAQALAKASPQDAEAQLAATNASFACAEGLLGEGNKAAALAVYKRFAGEGQPKHVRLAATRGMLACAGSGGTP
jgi:HEAT repeat protein